METNDNKSLAIKSSGKMSDCQLNSSMDDGNDMNDLTGIVEMMKEIEDARFKYAKANAELRQDLADLTADGNKLEELIRDEQNCMDDNEAKIQALLKVRVRR